MRIYGPVCALDHLSVGNDMARINISIPDETKAQMEDFHTDANWSAIAHRAFEREISTLKSLKESTTMDGIIERLRASKETEAADDFETGETLGREWATTTASYGELKRLGSGDYDVEIHGPEADDDALRELFAVVRKLTEREYSGEDVRDFWVEDVGGDNAEPSARMVQGFLEGAKIIWYEVGVKI